MIDKVSFKGFLTSTDTAKMLPTRGMEGFKYIRTNQIFDRIYLNKVLSVNPEDIAKTSRIEDRCNGDIITLDLKDGSTYSARTNWVSLWAFPNTTVKNYWSVHSENVPALGDALQQIYSRFTEISERFRN